MSCINILKFFINRAWESWKHIHLKSVLKYKTEIGRNQNLKMFQVAK